MIYFWLILITLDNDFTAVACIETLWADFALAIGANLKRPEAFRESFLYIIKTLNQNSYVKKRV